MTQTVPMPLLSFPAPGHSWGHSPVGTSVRFDGSIGVSDMYGILDAIHIRHLHLAHVDRCLGGRLAHASSLLSASTRLRGLLLVCRKVERDEEE